MGWRDSRKNREWREDLRKLIQHGHRTVSPHVRGFLHNLDFNRRMKNITSLVCKASRDSIISAHVDSRSRCDQRRCLRKQRPKHGVAVPAEPRCVSSSSGELGFVLTVAEIQEIRTETTWISLLQELRTVASTNCEQSYRRVYVGFNYSPCT